ncbi:MAG: GNAT family N-acetyltransferase, partial [Pyrinomonadaceae bacterium]
TGVVPAYRRRGLSRAMFEMMLAEFAKDKIEQFLLEVVTTNTAAISLYEQLGFRSVRELSLLQCDKHIENNSAPAQDIEIRDVIEPDWRLLETFWDAKPSWQNSIDAITRCSGLKRFLGAYKNERCVGYVIFSARFGRIAQFAVSKTHRNQGIGSALFRALKNEIADGFSMQVINIPKSLTETIGFFEDLGFYERLSQHEMKKPL